MIRFKATLLRPATPKTATWSFLVLPANASAALPTRGMVHVEGAIDGHAFGATLAPDGQGSHWMKVGRAVREAAGVRPGDTVDVRIAPSGKVPAVRVPADLRRALDAAPAAATGWAGLTPAARRDWLQWLDSAKKAETRGRRIASTCDMLASGKRRVCCFDRSGIYSKALAAPQAAE